jgi:hypothetical protein
MYIQDKKKRISFYTNPNKTFYILNIDREEWGFITTSTNSSKLKTNKTTGKAMLY